MSRSTSAELPVTYTHRTRFHYLGATWHVLDYCLGYTANLSIRYKYIFLVAGLFGHGSKELSFDAHNDPQC